MPWYYRPARRRVVREVVDDAPRGPLGPGPGHPLAFFGNPLLVAGFLVLLAAVIVIAIAASR
jgi:hypothetical protein